MHLVDRPPQGWLTESFQSMKQSSSRGFRKLPKRYGAIVMPFVLSIFMTCLVSAISTLRGLGFSHDFFRVWPGAWAVSWLIAFPALLLVLPLVRRIVTLLVETEG